MRSDLLYHGTSSRRFALIEKGGLARIAPVGDKWLSMTPIYDVAVYFAELAAWADVHDHKGDGVGCILVFSRKALDGAGYLLTKIQYDDPCDEYAWEQEIVCWRDVDLKSGVLIDVQLIRDAAERVNQRRRKSSLTDRHVT